MLKNDKKYIFLDAWVTTEFLIVTEKAELLKNYIIDNGLTVLFSTSVLVEGYDNREKDGIPFNIRAKAIAEFVENIGYEIVNPSEVYQYECRKLSGIYGNFPAYNFGKISPAELPLVLYRFMIRHEDFVETGTDIGEWFIGINKAKSEWESDRNNIINTAIADGYLEISNGKCSFKSENQKMNFLISLDLRHFKDASQAQRINERYFKIMRATHLTSCFFAYQYIESDAAFPLGKKGSDLYDHLNLSIIPYCSVMTADKTMCRLWQWVSKNEKLNYPCKVLNKDELAIEIGLPKL
jgi:hypothetical protein